MGIHEKIEKKEVVGSRPIQVIFILTKDGYRVKFTWAYSTKKQYDELQYDGGVRTEMEEIV